jgi:hypothetical protein
MRRGAPAPAPRPGPSATEAREDRLFLRICEILSVAEQQPARVIGHPDREGVSGGCDAIICRGGVEWAAEHTLVHSIPAERWLLHLLDRFKGPIEEAVASGHPGRRFNVCVPMEEIPAQEREWGDLQQAIAAECIRVAGEMSGSEDRLLDVRGVPFRVLIHHHWSPGVGPGRCSVLPRLTEQARLTEDLLRALSDKGPKLARQKEAGRKTLLVLDGERWAWCGEAREAFREAAEQVSLDFADEIFWADIYFFYCIKKNGQVLPEPLEWSSFWEIGRAHV